MKVIPAINCENFDCVESKLKVLEQIGCDWIHFDISDGEFSSAVTWNEPSLIKNMISDFPSIEVHLMVREPEEFLSEWVGVGAKRFLVHIESIYDSPDILNLRLPNVEMGISLLPNTLISNLLELIDKFPHISFVQFLAVSPGYSGQKFDEKVIDKISELLVSCPGLVVEVDGGITPETARLVSDVGASVVVSSSYIWGHNDLKTAILELKNVT
jgi:ribulose-phosphate 3-epimerase